MLDRIFVPFLNGEVTENKSSRVSRVAWTRAGKGSANVPTMGSGNLSSLLGGWPCEGLECARPCVTNPRRMKVNTRLEFRGNEHVRADRRAEGMSFSRPSGSRFTDRPTDSPSSPRLWRISPRPVFDFSSCIVVRDICESPPDNKGSLLPCERGARNARKNSRANKRRRPLFEGWDFLTPERGTSIISSRRNGNFFSRNNNLLLLDKN